MKLVFNALVCLLLATAVLGQSSTPPSKELPVSPGSQTSQAEGSSLAPDAPVITIQGLCERLAGSSATPSDCKTVLTRADFEKFLRTPNTPAAQKKMLADQLVPALVLQEKAHEDGLDHSPDFEKSMSIARLTILRGLELQELQKQSSKVSDTEIEDYYKQHINDYKAVSFEKLYVPKQKFVETSAVKPNDPDAEKKREASEAEMKAEADKLRAKATAGADFNKLQQEAYDFAGLKQTAQSTRMENQRKSQVLAADSAIFELKAGDVSQVFNDPAGFMVYKIVEFKDLPVASVHDEIARTLQAEKMKSAMDSLTNSVKTTLDESYFGASAPGANAPTLRKPGETPAQNPAPSAGKTPPPPGQK